MPITVHVIDSKVIQKDIDDIFDYFVSVDNRFSTYKKNSEISKINRGEISEKNYSLEMKKVLKLCEKTKKETNGYFDITHNGIMDPSGLVKGWAIQNAAQFLQKKKFKNYYVEAGGDIQTSGFSSSNKKWRIGIRNPYQLKQIVKVLYLGDNEGIATSGNYERGEHIYNPKGIAQKQILSITVIGPNVLEADRFATAAFAMGEKGVEFIENKKDLEGYMIDTQGIATMTSGFEKYVKA